MTHEQKKESAELRTREAQRRHIAQSWADEGMSHALAYEWANRELREAEARGAAEQRRKDAKGAEPVGFTDQDALDRVKKGKSGDIYSSPRPEGVDEDYWPIPLYAQPANVAALEARVKELEGALSYLKDEALRFADMYPQSSDMRNSFGVFASKIKAHAAAIREGG